LSEELRLRNPLIFLCFASGIAANAVCLAQAPVTPTAASTFPSIPVTLPSPSGANTAENTSIDLIVHDRKGRPVADLKPEELSVLDAGISVKNINLRLVHADPAHEPMVALVFAEMDPSALKNARSVAAKILKLFPDAGFDFAVFGVDGRLRVFQPYTGDRAAVSRALAEATLPEAAAREEASFSREKNVLALAQSAPGTLSGVDGAKARSQAETICTALRQSQQIEQDRHIDPDLAGLTAIAQAERQLPGRKAVLYFAQSAQPDVNTVDQMLATAKTANQAGISIYPIDMNAVDVQASDGLAAANAMGAVSAANRLSGSSAAGPVTGIVPIMTSSQVTQMNDGIDEMEADGTGAGKSPLGRLCALTGGVCVGSNESLRKPIQRLVADLSSYYEITYSPEVEVDDGKFRPVSVKSRRPGLSIHARSGYYALPRGEESKAQPADTALVRALQSPNPPSDIAFRSALLQFGKTDGDIASEVAVEVPLANLQAREDPNTDLFSFDVAVAARIEDAAGKIVGDFSEEFRRHGGLDTLDSARSGLVGFQRRVSLPPGEYTLKTAVVDSASGKAGVQSQPIHIAAPPVQLSLSELVLLRPGEDGRPGTIGTEGTISPNLAGSLPASAKDASIFFFVHAAEKAENLPQVAIAISKDGKQIGNWPLRSANDQRKGLVPYLSAFNAAALPPGSYNATVSVRQGDQTAVRHLVFVKEGTAPESSAADAGSAAEASNSPLEATSAPLFEAAASSAEAPSQKQIDSLIGAARKRALGYSAKLPNFMCIEVIDRSVDRSGKGHWTHEDTISEMLRYRDNTETRVVLEVDGRAARTEPDEMKGMHSRGEFGGLLQAIFDPAAEARFTWQSEKRLSTGAVVQVFSYRVDQQHSSMGLTDNNNSTLNVAFHGDLYIEPETGAVRYATATAQDLPAKFGIHASSIQVVYDYVAINSHDYLLPVKGTIGLSEGKHRSVLNTLQFRNYKRFSSQSRVLPVSESTSAH
jgi:VWFA-related protein